MALSQAPSGVSEFSCWQPRVAAHYPFSADLWQNQFQDSILMIKINTFCYSECRLSNKLGYNTSLSKLTVHLTDGPRDRHKNTAGYEYELNKGVWP